MGLAVLGLLLEFWLITLAVLIAVVFFHLGKKAERGDQIRLKLQRSWFGTPVTTFQASHRIRYPAEFERISLPDRQDVGK